MSIKQNSIMAGLILLLLSTVAFSQVEQTFSFQVEVAPYVLLKDTAMTFTRNQSDSSSFDTDWVDLAYSNTKWQMNIEARPIAAVLPDGSTRELRTDYLLEVNVNGKIVSHNFTVRPGSFANPFALLRQAVPHNGSISIRMVATATDKPADATGFVAPGLPALTYSVATF